MYGSTGVTTPCTSKNISQWVELDHVMALGQCDGTLQTECSSHWGVCLLDPPGPICYTWARSRGSSRGRIQRSFWNLQQTLPFCLREGSSPRTHTRHRHGMLTFASCNACGKGFRLESALGTVSLRPSTQTFFLAFAARYFNNNPFSFSGAKG